jgi:hypothetical protein
MPYITGKVMYLRFTLTCGTGKVLPILYDVVSDGMFTLPEKKWCYL